MTDSNETMQLSNLQKLAVMARPFLHLLAQSSDVHGATALARDTKRVIRVTDAILGSAVLAATRRKASQRKLQEQVRDFQKLMLDGKLFG